MISFQIISITCSVVILNGENEEERKRAIYWSNLIGNLVGNRNDDDREKS